MDFGAIVSLNRIDQINWHEYPLGDCLFGADQGMQELKMQVTKKKPTSPKETLQIVVHLHEDHKVYFSDNLDIYEPFILPPQGGDHRAYIKSFFEKKYGLTLSVRPPFERTDQTISYHAQVQRGDA